LTRKKRRLTIIGGVLLACDHGLRVEERPVRTSLDIIDDARLEIHVDGTRDVFSGAGLGKESCETVLSGFSGTFLKTAVGLWVSSALDAIIEEHEARTLNPCSRVYSSPLCRNVYMVRRVKHDQDSKKLTAGVTNLDTSLTDVNGDDFPHGFVRIRDVIEWVGEGEDGGECVR
jgi:hypothetical protein